MQVGPFGDRITVLFGPNGTGKSTLFDAMARALLDRHSVGSVGALALRPWGRNLAPTVAVEFVHQGVEYRLEKKFLDHPSALLHRREAGRFVRLEEAAAADQRVRGVLKGEAAGAGVSLEQASGGECEQILLAARPCRPPPNVWGPAASGLCAGPGAITILL